LTYDGNGAEIADNTTLTKLKSEPIAAAELRSGSDLLLLGYDFAGWSETQLAAGTVGTAVTAFPNGLTADKTVYAIWQGDGMADVWVTDYKGDTAVAEPTFAINGPATSTDEYEIGQDKYKDLTVTERDPLGNNVYGNNYIFDGQKTATAAAGNATYTYFNGELTITYGDSEGVKVYYSLDANNDGTPDETLSIFAKNFAIKGDQVGTLDTDDYKDLANAQAWITATGLSLASAITVDDKLLLDSNGASGTYAVTFRVTDNTGASADKTVYATVTNGKVIDENDEAGLEGSHFAVRGAQVANNNLDADDYKDLARIYAWLKVDGGAIGLDEIDVDFSAVTGANGTYPVIFSLEGYGDRTLEITVLGSVYNGNNFAENDLYVLTANNMSVRYDTVNSLTAQNYLSLAQADSWTKTFPNISLKNLIEVDYSAVRAVNGLTCEVIFSVAYEGRVLRLPVTLTTYGRGGGGITPPATSVPEVEILEEEELPLEFIGDHIRYLYGYADGTVRPDGSITRAEAAAIFHRLLANADKDTYVSSSFTDISGADWFYQAVAYLQSQGIVAGYPDGSFQPNATITRAEYATMASQFDALSSTGGNNFSDVDISHWAVRYINSAASKGWVSGFEDGTFRPGEDVTRAQVVSIVNRMLGRKIALEDIPSNVPVYQDITSAHWAYCDVIEASVTHGFTYNEAGTEIWLDSNGEIMSFMGSLFV
jgi:uncharacterized repeat protein (TIGR02543 family)